MGPLDFFFDFFSLFGIRGGGSVVMLLILVLASTLALVSDEDEVAIGARVVTSR